MEPYQIEHLVEVIGSDGQIDQIYNYLVYKFQDSGAYVWRGHISTTWAPSVYLAPSKARPI